MTRFEQATFYAVLFLALVGFGCMLPKPVEAASVRADHKLGVLYSAAPEVVTIGKAERVASPEPAIPEQSEACTRHNWESCNAAFGGIAFTCARDATWVFMGCLPMCQWRVYVKISCGCP